MNELCGAEDHQRRRHDKRRVQALRQRDTIERNHHGPPADDADDGAEHGLAAEFEGDMRGRAVPDRDELDQHQREEHREWIVAAGLGLQRCADAGPQPQALRMNQQEHRSRIRRRHHGADQERLGPVQIERIFGDGRGDQRGKQHTDRRQHH